MEHPRCSSSTLFHFGFWVSVLKLNIRKRGPLILKGYWGTLNSSNLYQVLLTLKPEQETLTAGHPRTSKGLSVLLRPGSSGGRSDAA